MIPFAAEKGREVRVGGHDIASVLITESEPQLSDGSRGNFMINGQTRWNQLARETYNRVVYMMQVSRRSPATTSISVCQKRILTKGSYFNVG